MASTLSGGSTGVAGFSSGMVQAIATLIGNSVGASGRSSGVAIGCDFHIQIWGQSNAVGFADFSAAGGAGADQTGSDATLFADFPACNFRQLSSTAPATAGNAQTYNINTGVIPLRPYAAAGGNNVGAEQSLGRNLVKYKLCTNPYIGKVAIASSSIPGHWAKASGFPSVGTTVYQQMVNSWNASVAETGRNIDVIVHQIGETDANTPARVTSAIADIISMYNNLRIDVPGCANAIVVIVMVNPFASLPGDGDVAGYRAQQKALVDNDTTGLFVLVDPFDIPLRSDPHYGAGGYWSLGDRILLAIQKKLFPNRSLNLGTGPTAYYQADEPVTTAQVSPAFASPRGAFDERENDVQVLIAASYTQVTTHTLVSGHDAGFLPLLTLTDSFSTNHHSLSLWYRVVKNNLMTADAAGNLRMPVPQVQFSASTLNLTEIVTLRGADPNNPFSVVLPGANNAFNTSLLIPSSTTPTTVSPNTLALIIACTTGATNLISSFANASLSGITVQRNGRANPGAGVVGLAYATGVVNGTSLGQTTIATLATGVNVGAVLAVNPAPVTITGGSTGAAGASTGAVQVAATMSGASTGQPGTSSGVISTSFSTAIITGTSIGAPGASTGAIVVPATISGGSFGNRGLSIGTMSVTSSGAPPATISGGSLGAPGFSGGVVIAGDAPITTNPITWADVLAEAPELARTSPLAQEAILDFVNTKIVVSGIDGEFGRKTFMARVLRAAHIATLLARRGAAGWRTSQSSGGVSESISPYTNTRLGDYALTTYGVLYAQILGGTAHRAGQLLNRRVRGPGGFGGGSGGSFGGGGLGGFGGGGF